MLGSRYVDLAKLYVKQFPFRKAFNVKQFDSWAFKIDKQYRLERIANGPGDDGWGTHLQNRHMLKRKINEGGRCTLLNPKDMFQIQCASTTWRTMPLLEHTSGLARSFSSRAQRTMKTRLKTIYNLTDKSDHFPKGARVALDRIAVEMGLAQEHFDLAQTMFIRRLDMGFAEIRTTLAALRADGIDISECAALLRQAGIPLDMLETLPKPRQLQDLTGRR